MTAANVQTYAPTYALKKKSAPEESDARALTPVNRILETSTRVTGADSTQYLSSAATRAEAGTTNRREFTFRDRNGRVISASVINYPIAKIDPRLSPTLTRAASIAQERAHAHSKSRCWRYVKNALLASGAISSYPKTAYAKQAGEELVRAYGFKRLPIRDPYAAPVGAVLVYGSRRAAGHVEIRTKTGFVSDFLNKKPSPRPLIGIYAKA